MKKADYAASWRIRVRSASFGLVEIRIFVRSLKRKNLEFIVRKPICSRTEAFDNRGLTVLLIKNDFIHDATYATKCLIMSLRQYGNDVCFSSLVPNQNQVFYYIGDINLKRISSLKGSFPRHCARATQLLSKRFCSGGEALATLCVQFDMPEI